MGLTIHTQLQLPRAMPDTAVQLMVRTVHAAATRLVRRRGLAAIGPVVPIADQPFAARWVLVKIDAHTSTGVEVPPLAGWCFAVAPGADCEPAIFGLGRYPASVTDAHARVRRTRMGRGWSFASSCKTQYAGMHGWKHFLKCHRAVVDLAGLWETAGVEVEITDEGGYWPARDLRALRRQLTTYDRIVAGFAGAMKDAAGDDPAHPVQATIFQHPQFERLEAEGVKHHEEKLRAATKVVAGRLKRPGT